jgi:hypothetical protein
MNHPLHCRASNVVASVRFLNPTQKRKKLPFPSTAWKNSTKNQSNSTENLLEAPTTNRPPTHDSLIPPHKQKRKEKLVALPWTSNNRMHHKIRNQNPRNLKNSHPSSKFSAIQEPTAAQSKSGMHLTDRCTSRLKLVFLKSESLWQGTLSCGTSEDFLYHTDDGSPVLFFIAPTEYCRWDSH